MGAAIFTLISAYGFSDLERPGAPIDPTRVAAQIVTGGEEAGAQPLGFVADAERLGARGDLVGGRRVGSRCWSRREREQQRG